MSQENVDALRNGYDAFSSGNIDEAFENFADDIVWKGGSDLVPGGGTYNGIDDLKNKWLPEFGSTFQNFSQSVDEILDCGDYAIALGSSRATVAGQEIEADFCHVWKYSGDKIVEARFFGDSAPVYKALQGQ